MSATADLREEHEAVLLMLDILEGMAARSADQIPIPAQDRVEVLDFLRTFVDKCHHSKEEGFLFPALQDAGTDRDRVMVKRLLEEHEQGRVLVRRLADDQEWSADAGPGGAGADAPRSLMTTYVRLLRRHIEAEEKALFPAADGELPTETQADAEDYYGRIEEDVIGEGRHEAFHRTLTRLRGIYVPV